ncbi:glycosyltransferase family 4 protein [Psychromonas sp. SA13A]|uniref:glycosyltransferase family 4 protein n=1 Tax=Psychromonas sp. SA13A TaxID=2686346 RepID=UPI00140997B2|nr:glycosyltransferase family 4 protein [Psychromonas sp. SA13A]
MQKEINIVHYWGGFPIIATSKWLRTLALINKCAGNGWNNWLVLSKEPDDLSLVEPFVKAGCKIIYIPRSKGNFDFRGIYRNIIFLRKIKCDIFHCHNDHTSPIIAALLSFVPVKIWSKLSMSSAYEKNEELSGLGRLMASTRITCWCADQILAISDAVKKEVCEQVGFERKIDVVHAPVPIDKYIQATGEGVRKEFGVKQTEFLIVAVGHFAEVKGWDIAVEAFAEVNKQNSNTKLLLVGKTTSKSFYNRILMLIKNNSLEKNVVFAGNRSDIPDILNASDLFVFPSRSEGAGAALIEAMAAGLPCIATNTGGIPGIIENGCNGFLFERDNVVDLSDKIIKLIMEPELKFQLINSAKKGLEKFTIEAYVENVFSHYQRLLKENNL